MSNVDKVFFDYVTAEEVEDAAKHEQQGAYQTYQRNRLDRTVGLTP